MRWLVVGVTILVSVLVVGIAILTFATTHDPVFRPQGVPRSAVNTGSMLLPGRWYDCSVAGSDIRCDAFLASGGSPVESGLFWPRTADQLEQSHRLLGPLSSEQDNWEATGTFFSGRYLIWRVKMETHPVHAQRSLRHRDRVCGEALLSGRASEASKANAEWHGRSDAYVVAEAIKDARESGLVQLDGDRLLAPARLGQPAVALRLAKVERVGFCELAVRFETIG